MKKKKRPTNPVFIDEPIQWHMNNSRHDRCPLCGNDNVYYIDVNRRDCPRCDVSIRFQGGSRKSWLRDKLQPNPDKASEVTLSLLQFSVGENTLPLNDAQSESIDEIAVARISYSYDIVHWGRSGWEPIRSKGTVGSGDVVFALAGSPLWYALRLHPIWLPNQPKTVLDKIVDVLVPSLIVSDKVD